MTNSENLMNQVDNFVNKVNEELLEYYTTQFSNLTPGLITIETRGSKYVKLIHDRSVWGFISKYDGVFKGAQVKVGDLMKAASWSAPAKHSRGNIIDGTASYTEYGPSYIK